MIEIYGATKLFNQTKALNNVSFNIEDGSVFGLVGSNGAGKSTLLRTLAGVFSLEEGKVLINGEEPFENKKVKQITSFVSDFPCLTFGSNLKAEANYFKSIYPSWSDEKYNELVSVFPISDTQRFATMSKGMQRQVALILAFSCMPKVLLFDEIFDGLDPVIRELVKKIVINYVSETNATVVIASHNLREFEGFCDHIGLLHNGGILMEKDINSDETGLYRVQFVMEEDDFNEIRPQMNITKESRQGKMIELTVRGQLDNIEMIINSKNPVFFEVLPLTLEELFISEMEVAGYDINNFKI